MKAMLKKLLIILLCAVQLAVPATLIAAGELRNQQILKNGTEYTFELSYISFQRGTNEPAVGFELENRCKYYISDRDFEQFNPYIFTDQNGISVISDSCPNGYTATGNRININCTKTVEVTPEFEKLFTENDGNNDYIYLENGLPDVNIDYDSFDFSGEDGFWINGKFTPVYAVCKVYKSRAIFTDLIVDGVSFADISDDY